MAGRTADAAGSFCLSWLRSAVPSGRQHAAVQARDCCSTSSPTSSRASECPLRPTRATATSCARRASRPWPSRVSRMVTFDNLDGRLGCAELDAALTATTWQDRILGESRMVSVPLLMTWYATGNNVALGGDTARRVCPIRLETPEERPEERQGFRYPHLLAHVESQRSTLLGAALTILRAYIRAGTPDMGLSAWGSYEAWSQMVRGAVVWIDLPDPARGRIEMQDRADDGATAMRSLIEALRRADPDGQGLTAAQMVERPANAEGASRVAGRPARCHRAVGRATRQPDAGHPSAAVPASGVRWVVSGTGRYVSPGGAWAIYPSSGLREGESGEPGESVSPGHRRGKYTDATASSSETDSPGSPDSPLDDSEVVR